MHTTKIKICGITQTIIAQALVDYPIDAIGLVFYEKSPRFISAEQAQAIIDALPPFINRVGLFVNAKPAYIEQIMQQVSIDTLQFHGNETPNECEQYNLPYIKAVRMNTQTDLNKIAHDYHRASALLLDADNPYKFGGTGEVFDWELLNQSIKMPIILAGGLTVNNVAEATAKIQPYGVDVSSGVEKTPAIKDLDKIKQFITQVHGL